ncbi:dihydroorotate dehydrogenase, partial [Vibrio parahaemolyticus]|nr:dihydroorotate dehydrogenase [Vibrio parahaemolyticus]
GADLIQVGSANFRDIYASKKIAEGIEEFMAKEKISNLKEIKGIIGG